MWWTQCKGTTTGQVDTSNHLCFFYLSRQFQISIVVERPDGREIAKPVELRVMVGDANDNRPTFPQAQYHTVVKELAARGSWPLFIYLAVSKNICKKNAL